MSRPRNDPGELADLPTALSADRPKGDQIREILRRLTGTLAAGSVLPSERVLAERLGVARMTVRQEVDRIVAEGRAARRPGGGTFVADVPPPRMLVASSFSRDMLARGLRPGAKVLEHEVITATGALAARLEEPEGTRALRLVRLRTADDEPMAIERTTLSLRRYPGLEELDFGKLSLYGELAGRWGVVLGLVSASVVASPPDPADAELLGIEPNTPCLIISSEPRTASGEVIESGRSIYRSDRYDLTIAYRAT
ncbi:GntR family transcriptional regulator [Kribbella deserti]|uniref:GntR family transcriptional regulator n=1 Tax=Kribbella deserti TaxID=1926257 RepID=A0ABV6QHT1_9ACTN